MFILRNTLLKIHVQYFSPNRVIIQIPAWPFDRVTAIWLHEVDFQLPAWMYYILYHGTIPIVQRTFAQQCYGLFNDDGGLNEGWRFNVSGCWENNDIITTFLERSWRSWSHVQKAKAFLKGHVHIAVVNARALICFDGWAWLCIVFLLSRLKRQWLVAWRDSNNLSESGHSYKSWRPEVSVASSCCEVTFVFMIIILVVMIMIINHQSSIIIIIIIKIIVTIVIMSFSWLSWLSWLFPCLERTSSRFWLVCWKTSQFLPSVFDNLPHCRLVYCCFNCWLEVVSKNAVWAIIYSILQGGAKELPGVFQNTFGMFKQLHKMQSVCQTKETTKDAIAPENLTEVTIQGVTMPIGIAVANWDSSWIASPSSSSSCSGMFGALGGKHKKSAIFLVLQKWFKKLLLHSCFGLAMRYALRWFWLLTAYWCWNIM